MFQEIQIVFTVSSFVGNSVNIIVSKQKINKKIKEYLSRKNYSALERKIESFN